MSWNKYLLRFLAAMFGSAIVLAITGIYISGHNIQTPDISIDWGPVQISSPGVIMMIVTFSIMALSFGLVIWLTRSKPKLTASGASNAVKPA
jgi:hypothetical protein